MKPVWEFFVKLNYYWTTSISRSSFVYQLCRWRALLRIFTWWREKNWSFQKVSPIFLDEKCYVFLNGPPPILHVLRKSRVRPKFWKKFVTIQHIGKKATVVFCPWVFYDFLVQKVLHQSNGFLLFHVNFVLDFDWSTSRWTRWPRHTNGVIFLSVAKYQQISGAFEPFLSDFLDNSSW